MAMYNAILKWSLSQTDGFTNETARENDTDTKTAAEPMSEERRDFLMKAMKQYIVNETERINDIIQILKYKSAGTTAPNTYTGDTTMKSYHEVIKTAVDVKVNGGQPDIASMLSAVPAQALNEMKIDALLELQERVEQMDNACFFACTCNGSGEIELVLDLMLKHPSWRVRIESARVLSTVLQNNATAQTRAGKISDFLQKVINAIDAASANLLNNGSSKHDDELLGQIHDMQTSGFSVITSYIRGENASIRVNEFLSVKGIELLWKIFLSSQSQSQCEWQRYTPAGKKQPREGWWRQIPHDTLIPAGSEVAMDMSQGVSWLRYAGNGDPPAPSSSQNKTNPRLMNKVLFFLQFLLREFAKSKESSFVASILNRLDINGNVGEILLKMAADIDAPELSERAAQVLLKIFQIPAEQGSVLKSNDQTNKVSDAVKPMSSPLRDSKALVVIDTDSDTSTAINKDDTTQLQKPSRKQLTISEFRVTFKNNHGAKVQHACEVQRVALLASTNGDPEQMEYIQEPLDLFEALSNATRELA